MSTSTPLTQARMGEVVYRHLRRPATLTQLAYYCAAVGVVDPIHYDRLFAREAGFPDAVVNGSLRIAWMSQVLVDFSGPEGRLVQLRCNHRGLLLVGQSMVTELLLAEPIQFQFDGDIVRIRLDVRCLSEGKICDSGEALCEMHVSKAHDPSQWSPTC